MVLLITCNIYVSFSGNGESADTSQEKDPKDANPEGHKWSSEARK